MEPPTVAPTGCAGKCGRNVPRLRPVSTRQTVVSKNSVQPILRRGTTPHVKLLFLPAVSLLVTKGTRMSVFANIGRGYTPAFARTAAGFPLDPETGVNAQIGLSKAGPTACR